jgi:O-antigen ligase
MKKAVHVFTVGAIFLIPFLALFVSNSLFFPFITGKNFAFRILVEIAVAGWVLLMLLDAKYRPRFSWIAIIFTAFVAWMAFADALAVNPAKAFWSNFERMDGWVTLIHLLMLFFVMGSIFSVDKLWRKWWFTFLGVAGIICAYALLQSVGVLAIHQGAGRLDATFGNSDYLACFLLFTIAITIWQAFEAKVSEHKNESHIEKKQRKMRMLWLRYGLVVFAAIQMLVLILTQTRGAVLGFVGAIGVGAILWAVESGKKGRRAAGAALIALLVVVGIFFLVRNTSFIQHDPALSRLATISLKDPETATRLIIWGMAIQGFEQKPITGWGQEGFNYVFNQYYKPTLYEQEPWFDRAHNMYLDWLVAGGAPALILFLSLLGITVIALYRSNISRPERILFLSALAAYMFQGIFVFDNLFSYVPFIAILAMVYGTTSRPIEKVEKWPVLDENDFLTYGLPIVGVALLLMLWFVNVPNIRAGGDIITAITPSADPTTNLAAFKAAYADGSFADQEITEQLLTYAEGIITSTDPGITNDVKEQMYAYAVQQMQLLVTKIPHDARLRLEFALLYRSAGDFPDALAQIQIAEQLSPDKQSIMTEQGIEDLESGNTAAANAVFSKAYNLDPDPTFTDLAAYDAAGDILTNQVPAAKAILLQTFGTTTPSQQILLAAYFQAKDYPDLLATAIAGMEAAKYSADSEYAYAEALSDAGEYAQARAEIQTAMTQYPETASEGTAILAQIPTSTASK